MADEKAVPAKTPVEKAAPLVFLFLEHPHTRFELDNVGLPDLLPTGTGYSAADADIVRMLCLKYGIRYRESA